MKVYMVIESTEGLTGVVGVYSTLEHAVDEAKKLGKVRVLTHGTAVFHGHKDIIVINRKIDEPITEV